MDVSGVNSSTNLTQLQQNQEYARKRISLHQSSSFQLGGSGIDLSALTQGGDPTNAVNNTQQSRTLQTRDGTEIELPQLTAAERAKSEAVYAQLSPEAAAAVKASAKKLATAAYIDVAAQRAAANGAPDGQALLEASQGTLRSAAVEHVSTVAAAKFNKSTSAMSSSQFEGAMTDAMTTGMSSVESNLYDFLGGFMKKAGMSNEVDTDAAELQTMINDWGNEETQQFTYHEVETDKDGNQTLAAKTVTLTQAQAEDLYKQLKATSDDLSTIGEADTLNLQMMVQDYQQAMTTLSNVMKGYNENLRGIIQNVKS
jgi:hypothetical protein